MNTRESENSCMEDRVEKGASIMSYDLEKEKREALEAGRRALASLTKAKFETKK